MRKVHWHQAALCALVLLGSSALAGPALGQNEHANPNASDNPGHSEDHGGGGGNNGGGNSGGNSGGGGGNGHGGENGKGGGGNSAPSRSEPSASVPAVPLESVIDQVKTVSDGTVIDAKLVTVRGFLLYEIRVLEPNDTVRRLYYYARSGRPVQ